MAIFFGLMAVGAFIGFGINAFRRNGHGMVYAAVVCAIWILLFLWWRGALG